MADSNEEFEVIEGNEMELLMESDEEEASLLEEMEKQAVNPIVTQSVPETPKTVEEDTMDLLTPFGMEKQAVTPIVSEAASVKFVGQDSLDLLMQFEMEEQVVNPIIQESIPETSEILRQNSLDMLPQYELKKQAVSPKKQAVSPKVSEAVTPKTVEQYSLDMITQFEIDENTASSATGIPNTVLDVEQELSQALQSHDIERSDGLDRLLPTQSTSGNEDTDPTKSNNDVDALHEKILQSVLKSKSSQSKDINKKNDQVQILQLDMSAQELFLAKSAAAFRYHDATFPAEAQLTSKRLEKVSALHPMNHGSTSSSNLNNRQSKEMELIKRILSPEVNTKSLSGIRSKNNPRSKSKKSKFTRLSEPAHKRSYSLGGEVKPAKKSRKSKFSLPPQSDPNIDVQIFKPIVVPQSLKPSIVDPYSVDPSIDTSAAHVSFRCNHCKFKCLFIKDKVSEIVAHLTPMERYHQLLKVPQKLKAFKENVKLTVMISKNKAKAQVRFLNRLECDTCHQHIDFDVEHGDQIVNHYHWCMKKVNNSNTKTFTCLFCNKTLHRSSLKKHLSRDCKKQCPVNVAATLQLMSCVCKKYAEDYMPMCVVCNEKRWPYLGHRPDMDPVCEPCRKTIVSGNTTQLVVRDVTGCAICGKRCADNFVTYWASELESLFIGETCLTNLNCPVPSHAEEIIKMKKEKIKSLVEMAVESVNSPSSELMRLQSISSSKATADFSDSQSVSSLAPESNIAVPAPTSDIPVPNWNDPVPRVAANGAPLAGSFKILGSTVSLPFTTITSGLKQSISVPRPDTSEMIRVRSATPTEGSFALLLPTSNTPLSPKLPHTNKGPVTIVRVGGSYPTPQSKENSTPLETGNMSGINRISIRGENITPNMNHKATLQEGVFRVKTMMLEKTSVSRSNHTNTVPRTSAEFDDSKYVIKYASYPTPPRREEANQEVKDSPANNKDRIVIKTSSISSETKPNKVAPPRIAHVIRTQNNVFNNAWLGCGKGRKVRNNVRVLKPLTVRKVSTETVTLE